MTDTNQQQLTKDKSYSDLTWAMFRTGVLGFGGGPSIIPLIRHEAVNRYRWIDNDEFGEIVAIANALPGPIATKMAGYLGYRLKGSLGAVVAIIAHILPSSAAMIALLSIVSYLSDSEVIQNMIAAVIPVVAVMLGVMAYEFGEKAVKGLGKWIGIGGFALSFLLLQIFKVPEAIVIILFLLYGAFHYKLLGRLKSRKTAAEDNQHRNGDQ